MDHGIEDQGEWERCRSSRRMFLALHDSGRKEEIKTVARALLKLAEQHVPDEEATKQAREFWEHGMLEVLLPGRKRKPKEVADRSYLVIRCVAKAFDRYRALEDSGEIVVCSAIRRIQPLAPSGFRKVGSLNGKSASHAPQPLIYRAARSARRSSLDY